MTTLRTLLAVLLVGGAAAMVLALSVANRKAVTLSLDPLAVAGAGIVAPLYVWLFGAALLGVLAGGAASWGASAKWRRLAQARRAHVERLQRETDRLHRQLRQSEARAVGNPQPVDGALFSA